MIAYSSRVSTPRSPGTSPRCPAPDAPIGPVLLRLPKTLVDEMRRDLRRPHPFAAERVGFLRVATAEAEHGEAIVLALEYRSLPDDAYVSGRGAGVRIGTGAIRNAVADAITSGRGILHVHLHDHKGVPQFSRTDRREQPRLIQSLFAVSPRETHGMLVLSADAANAWLWLPGAVDPATPRRLVIVGDPMVLLSGDSLVRPSLAALPAPAGEDALRRVDAGAGVDGDRRAAHASTLAERARGNCRVDDEQYVRQSFLGPDSQRRLGFARVAILGYGGGGSHVGQQLAHLGVRHVIVADADRIDISNLNRLVGGTAEDVREARLKVDIARRVVIDVLPDAALEAHEGRWQDRPLLFRGCDVLVGCVDSFTERREIEVFARRFGIPYVDIGMDVHVVAGEPPRVGGQVILSMPGGPCMKCLGFLTEIRLAAEAARYGDAGGRPQVVWPNGILASSAVGVVVSILTGWTREENRVLYLSYDGNCGTVQPHPRLQFLGQAPCPHFPVAKAGMPRFRPVRVPRR